MLNNKRKENMEGAIFTTISGGDCRIIQYINNSKVIVKFLDMYGSESQVTLQSLRKGLVRNPYAPNLYNVGFLGVGTYAMTINGKPTCAHKAWSGVIERCYSTRLRHSRPCYSDVTISGDWHNFQNFAKWFYSQRGAELGWEIDKDLLVTGNKHYSPETCILLPRRLNTAIIHVGSNENVLGYSYHPVSKLYSTMVSTPAGGRNIYFKTKDECVKYYYKSKSEQLSSLANEWREELDPKAFDSFIRLSGEYLNKSLYG